jgi:hypothetical protein
MAESKYNDTFRDLIMDLNNIPAMMQKQREKKRQDMAPAGIRLTKDTRNTSSKESKSREPEEYCFQVYIYIYILHINMST